MASTFLDARVAAPAGLDSRVSAPVPARTPPLLHTRCRANCSRAHLALCACYRRGRHYRELHYAPRLRTPTFEAFARRPRALPQFLEALWRHLELEGVAHSHRLTLVPRSSPHWQRLAGAAAASFYVRVTQDNLLPLPPERPLKRAGNPSYDLATPLNYTDRLGHHVQPGLRSCDLLLHEDRRARAFLDAQGRPLYIVSPRRPARSPGELTPAEHAALWRAAFARNVLPPRRRGDGDDGAAVEARDRFEVAVVNVGATQNLPHLHLKVWDDERAHEELWRGNASYQKLRAGSAQMPPLDEDGAPSPPMRFYGV